MSWIKDARPLFLTGHKKETHCEESGANFIFVLENSPFQTIQFLKKELILYYILENLFLKIQTFLDLGMNWTQPKQI